MEINFRTFGIIFMTLIIPLKIFSQKNELKNINEISNEIEANVFISSLDFFFSSSLKILTREQLRNIKINTASSKETTLLELSDSLGIKNYEIIDFDNNGNVDLIIRGDAGGLKTILILDMGNEVYEEELLSQDEDVLIKASTLNDVPILEYYYYDCNRKIMTKTLRKNILIYKHDVIIEYNDQHTKPEIKEIIFEEGIGYKSEPKFQLKINNNGEARIKANSYRYWKYGDILNPNVKEFDGIYTSKIGKNSLDKLMEILNYINFKQLQKDCVISTNEFSFNMKIRYSDDSNQMIHDYKNEIPFSLNYIRDLIQNLKDEQNWKKDSK